MLGCTTRVKLERQSVCVIVFQFDSFSSDIWRNFSAEDVDFKFSLRPQNILSRTKMLKLRARNFVQQRRQGEVRASPNEAVNAAEIVPTVLEAGANAEPQLAFSGKCNSKCSSFYAVV